VSAGSHPDFTVLTRPEDEAIVKVERVRDFCAALSLKPFRGSRKVGIVEDADDFNDQAANCFLKTLEEPAPGSLLVLVGTSPERQLATIVSRCQVIRFAPLPAEVVRDLLAARGVDEALLARLVRMSGGSPGQALELAEPELWQFRRRMLESLSSERPDTVALGRGWEEFAKEADVPRRRASAVLRLLLGMLEQGLRLSLGVEPEGLETGERPLLERLARRFGPEGLLALLERCLESDDHLDANAQIGLVLEALTDAFATPAAGRG
jgi:DNA polymerase-3 subunit delta'